MISIATAILSSPGSECAAHGSCWWQQGEKPQKDRAQQTKEKEIIKQARLACIWGDSEHLNFHLRENKTALILKMVPVLDHLG